MAANPVLTAPTGHRVRPRYAVGCAIGLLRRNCGVVDWVPSRSRRPEGLVVVYDGGMLTTAEIDAITLPEDELAGFAFVAAEEVATRTSLLVGRRIAASLEAKAAGTVVSLEDGCVVG